MNIRVGGLRAVALGENGEGVKGPSAPRSLAPVPLKQHFRNVRSLPLLLGFSHPLGTETPGDCLILRLQGGD